MVKEKPFLKDSIYYITFKNLLEVFHAFEMFWLAKTIFLLYKYTEDLFLKIKGFKKLLISCV